GGWRDVTIALSLRTATAFLREALPCSGANSRTNTVEDAMRRSLAILTILAVLFSLLPLLPIAPVPEVFGASQTYTCTGSNDQVGIQNAINTAGVGDTVTVHNGPSYCDI